jgi:2-haloacid dehalogenase
MPQVPDGFLFDVYGTVCDWFTPMRNALALHIGVGHPTDADELARRWRNGYARGTSMRVRDDLDYIPLTDITRDALASLLAEHEVPTTAPELDALNGVWRRLPPWPDVTEGLAALKSIAPIAPCSNGHFSDMEALARFGGLPWTLLAGSEVSGQYKPHADTYLKSAYKLGADPGNCLMVACHQGDLKSAQSHGLQTAFVTRPTEFGGEGLGEEREVTGDWDWVASDFVDLARQIRDSS